MRLGAGAIWCACAWPASLVPSLAVLRSRAENAAHRCIGRGALTEHGRRALGTRLDCTMCTELNIDIIQYN